MDEGKGWLRTHWRTAVVLALIFGVALFLRVYFVYGLAFQVNPGSCDANFTPPYSGGSDSYYYDRTLCYSFQTGKDLGRDLMLNYPLGGNNPRPPLFPWFSLLVGRMLAPFYGNAWISVFDVWLLSSAIFGALTVFPTYALGKEAFGRKAGLIGALLLALSVGHLQRSSATDARSNAFYLFFVVSTFYFFLRALKTMKSRRWVENWFRPSSVVEGLRGFFRENRTSVLYSLFAGLSVSVIALAWQGWAYVIVILLVWYAVELFLDRFRNEDTMGASILATITLATPLLLALQWYIVRSQIRVWYDVPAYLFLASLVLGLAFMVTRDYPWTIVIPSTLIAAVIGLVVGASVNPTLASAFVTGAGYFIQSKVVTTIAEDQSPGMSQLVLSFGWFTFYLSLAALAYMLWQIPRRRDPGYRIAVIWTFVAIFMAITAARFVPNAAPAFAISAGFAIDQILVRADFAGARRTYRSLVEGNWRNAVRKSVKVRHVLVVLLLVFLVLVPNVWFAVDAAIPFELKPQYDRQVANVLPSWLRAAGYNPSSSQPFYFGAFGYGLPKSTDYFPAAWQWFATQDASEPPELRPAFLSWWDYGFEAIDRGVHPTVADNFQNGYAFAGQFITAQNESQGIALLSVRLLEGDFWAHPPTLSPAVDAAIGSFGLTPTTFETVFGRPDRLVPLVLSDPATYGLWDSSMIPFNAQYIYLSHLLSSRLTEERLVELYHSIRDATGKEIGYFVVDSRLMPISVQNTGIFYAPVKLSDHRVLQLPDGRVLPFEYFQIFANTSRGSNIPIQFVSPTDTVTSQVIQYQPAFYDSMFYRAYMGYSPTDLGNPSDKGLPGFDSALQSSPPVPAWNLTHWRVVYRTAYYNPFPDVANHTVAWQAMAFDRAQSLQAQIQAGKAKGVVDLSTQSTVANGLVFLRYYDGAWVNGTVRAGTTPVPGVRITVTDDLGTPHDVGTTDAQGHYSVLVPFGNVTITASIGSVTPRSLVGATTLSTFTVPVTMDQAMRVPADANADGIPDWIMTRDIQIPTHAASGTVFFDLNRDATFDTGDAVLPGASVTFANRQFTFRQTSTSGADGRYAIDSLPEGRYGVSVTANGRTVQLADTTITTTDTTDNLGVPFARVRGYASSSLGGAVAGATIELLDTTNGTTISIPTDGSGFYSVRPLMSGNFTVTASGGDLATIPAQLRIGTFDVWFNLTLRPSGRVAGSTTLFGTSLPFASLQFQSATNPRLVVTATSDAGATYSIRLPAGDWFVNGRAYAGASLYATLGEITVTPGVTTAYDGMFVDGVRLSGTVFDPNPGVRNPSATVTFASGSGQLWLATSATGGYLAFLPTGTYDLQAFNPTSARYASISLTASGTRDIHLFATTETVGWVVYHDLNGDGVADPGERIAGAHVALTDNVGARVSITTNATGEFQITLFGNRTYSGTITAPGYGPATIPVSSTVDLRTRMPIELTPTPVGVRGTVVLNGSALVLRPVTVRAVALAGGGVSRTTQSDSNGGYALGLVPGTYDLVVDENVSTTRASRYQNLGSDRIVVAVGQGSLAHDLNLAVRILVVGNVTLNGTARAASLTFDGPEHRTTNATTSGFEVYLIPGSYDVTGNRTIPPDEYAFLDTAAVPGSSSLTFVLGKAAKVTGLALFNGVAVAGPMPVTFVRAEGGSVVMSTDVFGSYTAFLVVGNYTVHLTGTNNATQGSVTRYYRYAFLGTMSVVPGAFSLVFNLGADRTLDNTTVSGRVTLNGVGVDANVNFYDRGGGAIAASVAAASNGAYTASLAPGTYDAYATRAVGSAAFFGRIPVPHAANVARDLPMSNGFVLSGVTTNPQGARVSTSITIETDAELNLTSDSTGTYSVVLPGGTYTVAATEAAVENGIGVTYRTTTSVALSADVVVNLALAKVVSRSVVLAWDASQRQQIPAGGSVSYTIVVRNTGNVPDTWSLSGRPTDWQFSFSPNAVALNFGNAANSSAVEVTITSPSNALVAHGTITIAATSSTDATTQGSVDVQVDILPTRRLGLSLDPTSAVFDGRYLNYTLVIKNSGNARETVDVAITNPNDLAAVGWTARLGQPAGPLSPTLVGVAVEANSTARLRLQAQSASGASGATVVVQVTAEDSMAVSATGIFTLQLPQLAPGGTTVSGPNVAHEAPLNLQLVAVVVGALAAIGAGLFLTRRRH